MIRSAKKPKFFDIEGSFLTYYATARGFIFLLRSMTTREDFVKIFSEAVSSSELGKYQKGWKVPTKDFVLLYKKEGSLETVQAHQVRNENIKTVTVEFKDREFLSFKDDTRFGKLSLDDRSLMKDKLLRSIPLLEEKFKGA